MSAKPTGKAPVATLGMASSEPFPASIVDRQPGVREMAVVDGDEIGRGRPFEFPVEREGNGGFGGGGSGEKRAGQPENELVEQDENSSGCP